MRPSARLALAAALFVALYYGARAAGATPWLCEAMLAAPAAAAGILLWRRGENENGRDRLFWRLLGAGPAVWAAGQILWTAAVAAGQQPGSAAGPLTVVLDACFIGFLAPMIAAVASRSVPSTRRDPVAWADTGLLLATLGFAFLWLVFLPLWPFLHQADGAPAGLLGVLALALAAWSASRWRRCGESSWARTHGLLALFALAYGLLSARANGSGGAMPPPGGPWDLVWILPFVLLAAAGLPAPAVSETRWSSRGFWVVLAVGISPLVLDLAARSAADGPRRETEVMPLVGLAALLALGGALRLRLQDVVEARAREARRASADEEHRSGRLATLASMSASLVQDLQRAMETTVARAAAAAPHLGDQGNRMLGQTERARTIVEDMARSLRLVRPAARGLVNVGSLLEQTVQEALEEGLRLRVSLAGLGGLPPVRGDAGALAAAFLHLLRNAAQAAPGGVLRVSAERLGPAIVLRFADEGPGVPAEVRDRIFDPFFTTKPLGKAVGLGLTLVHFVARDNGGSAILEPSEKGACFALRLPVVERRAAGSTRSRAPLAAAVLGAALLATLLVLVPAGEMPVWSAAVQVASAFAAALGLGLGGIQHRGRDRAFWVLLAAGPTAWGVAELMRWQGGMGSTALVLQALVELPFAVALLLRLGPRPSLPSVLTDAAALGLFAGLALDLSILPAAFLSHDPALALSTAAGEALLRLGLAAGAGALWLRGSPGPDRRLERRLTIGLAIWAVGATLGGFLRSLGSPAAASLGGLGFVLPFLLAASAGLEEARRGRREADTPGETAEASPVWPLALLTALALLPLLEMGLGAGAGQAALDSARAVATRWTMVAVAAALAARELAVRLLNVAPPVEAGAFADSSESPLRHAMAGLLHDLEAQLSGIRMLGRLLLLDPASTSPRVREAAARIQVRVELASQLVGSLLPAVRSTPTMAALGPIVEEVVDLREADLAHEGIVLQARVPHDLPLLRLDVPAIRQVVLGLVDGASLAMCQARRTGAIELCAAREHDRVVLRVSDQGPGLAAGRRRVRGKGRGLGADLRLAREIVSCHGATFEGHNRIPEGAEFVIRFPVPEDAPAAPTRVEGRALPSAAQPSSVAPAR